MIRLAADRGYNSASIAQLSAHAGVSSATFYEQFESKEACLLAAYHVAVERVFGEMMPLEPSAARTADEWTEQARVALGRLLDALEREPNAGRVVFIEARAAGVQVHAALGCTLEQLEVRAQAFLDSAPAAVGMLDIPAIALVGAMRSIISRRLRTHAEQELPGLTAALVAWLESYATHGRRARWSTSKRASLRPSAQPARSPDPRVSQRLPRGRHRLPPGVVARSQRTRIIHGTAEVMLKKGYAEATVADIVAAAGVARDVFYEHFRDKQHAFLEAQQHSTQEILDACAVSYFSVEAWPERVWHGLDTLISIIVANPALSHLRLVECYAAGPDAIRRAEEITRAFAVFLEEGYNCRPEAAALRPLASQAITGAIFEVIQRHAAEGNLAGLARELPRLAYVAIAPFTGADRAIELVEAIKARVAR